jgi:translation initiation factor 6 (eIF-6)
MVLEEQIQVFMQLNNQVILIAKMKSQNLTKFLKSINHFLNDKGVAIKKIRKRSNKFIQDFLLNKEFINM